MGLFAAILAVVFGILAATAGVATVLQRDSVRSVFFLTVSMVSASVVFIAIGAFFLALMQLLFTAVVGYMFYRAAISAFPGEGFEADRTPLTRYVGAIAAVLFFVILIFDLKLVSVRGVLELQFAHSDASDFVRSIVGLFTGWLEPLAFTFILVVTGFIALGCLEEKPALESDANGGER